MQGQVGKGTYPVILIILIFDVIFQSLQSTYQVASCLKKLLGLSWDDAKGLNIDITYNTWTEYVKVCNIPFSLSGVILTL